MASMERKQLISMFDKIIKEGEKKDQNKIKLATIKKKNILKKGGKLIGGALIGGQAKVAKAAKDESFDEFMDDMFKQYTKMKMMICIGKFLKPCIRRFLKTTKKKAGF